MASAKACYGVGRSIRENAGQCASALGYSAELTLKHCNRLKTHILGLNDIGTVEIQTHKPLLFDPYRVNRATGSFIIIDPVENSTARVSDLGLQQPSKLRTSRQFPEI